MIKKKKKEEGPPSLVLLSTTVHAQLRTLLFVMQMIQRRVLLQRQVHSFRFETKNSVLLLLIVPCTRHDLLLLGFGMDVQIEASKEELFLVDANTVASQSKTLKEEYIPFHLNQTPDGDHCSLYILSLSPPRIQNDLLNQIIVRQLWSLSIDRI